MRLTRPRWSAYAVIMGRCGTGYTAISGGMPGRTHSYRTHGLLAAAWGSQCSYGYGLFEAQMLSETIRWMRSLRGAECEVTGTRLGQQRHRCGRLSEHLVMARMARFGPRLAALGSWHPSLALFREGIG